MGEPERAVETMAFCAADVAAHDEHPRAQSGRPVLDRGDERPAGAAALVPAGDNEADDLDLGPGFQRGVGVGVEPSDDGVARLNDEHELVGVGEELRQASPDR